MLRPIHFAPLGAAVATELMTQVEAADPDHWLALPYVPDDKRAGCLAILALTSELRTLPGRVSDPMLGAIRLQWWREATAEVFGEAPPRRHPLVEALAETIGKRDPGARSIVDRMIDDTAAFLEPVETIESDTALDLARVHEGARIGLFIRWLVPDIPVVSLKALETLAALYVLGGARRWSHAMDTPASVPHEMPMQRLARAWAANPDLAASLPKPRDLWGTGTPWAQALTPMIAPYKWAGDYLAGNDLSDLRKRASLLITVLRGR